MKNPDSSPFLSTTCTRIMVGARIVRHNPFFLKLSKVNDGLFV